MNKEVSSELVVKDIRRRTRKKYSSEEKIRIVLDGLRGEDSISSLCRREGIPANRTIAGTKISWKPVRNVLWEIPSEKPAPMKWYDLKKENQHLKQLVAEITLKNRVLKKSLTGMDSEDIDL